MPVIFFFFFFNDTATTEIYTLSLHDALPIWSVLCYDVRVNSYCDVENTIIFNHVNIGRYSRVRNAIIDRHVILRSEEHTSELQSQSNLVCRLLLEKKKKAITTSVIIKRHSKI